MHKQDTESREWELGLDMLDALRDSFQDECADAEQARELIRLACKMARAEVNTGVELSERYFHSHVNGLGDARFHAAGWASIDAFCDALEDPVGFLADRSEDGEWDRWDALQDGVNGLGPAKAAMACALMGDRIGCVDRHMFGDIVGAPMTIPCPETGRQIANPVVADGYKKNVTRKRYPEFHKQAFQGKQDARWAQWDMFWKLTGEGSKGSPGAAFRLSSHMPYFGHVFQVMAELGA